VKTADRAAGISKKGYLALAIFSTALTAGAVFYPALMHWGYVPEAFIARVCYAPVCHQIESRSFHLAGYPLSVCERCFSIYTAVTLTIWLFPLIRRQMRERTVLIAAALLCIPMTLDWALDYTGLLSNSTASRSVTGFLGGIGIGYIAVSAWNEAMQRYRPNKTHPVHS